jgi:hypothetical protein
LQTHGLVLLLKELLVLQLSLTGLPILQTHGLAVCSAQQQNPQKVGHGGMASDMSRVLVTGVFADYLFCRLGIAMLYLDEAFHSCSFLARSSLLICLLIGHLGKSFSIAKVALR